MLLHDLLDRGADTAPAVADRTVAFDYRALRDATDRMTAWLLDNGISHGDRVVHHGRSSAWFVALLFATSRIGAVFVPVHTDLTAAQVSHIVRDSSARLVVTDHLDRHVDVSVAVVETSAAVRAADALGSRTYPGVAGQSVDRGVDPDDVALLIYTSGTTGAPKGVVCPHRTVLAAVSAIGRALDYRTDDVVLCRLPLSFDYGLYQVFLATAVGAAVVLADAVVDLRVLDLVRRHAVTVIPLVPALAQILRVVSARHRSPSSVRLFTNTGARLAPDLARDLLRAFPGARYASMYGMTECKRIAILPPAEFGDHPDSVGYPIDGLEVRIVGADGSAVPAGSPGEIVVRGTTVMSGYWNVDIADQSRFRPGPGGLELHTGDRGCLDRDGRLYFLGREDDLVKRNGVRISLIEIESCAEELRAVDEAVAVVTSTGELHLAVTGAVAPSLVRDHLARALDPARRPSSVLVLDAIPLTPNGKPDRRALGAEFDTPASTPTGDSHAALAV